MYLNLMVSSTSQIDWSQTMYLIISLVVCLAVVLGLIQLIKRIKFDPRLLRGEIYHFTKISGISDEMVIIDYVDGYVNKHLFRYDEIIRFLISSLTILGLLGTFVGLAQLIVPNFQELSNVMQGKDYDPKAFQMALSVITRGFSVAFNTSIVGIMTALLTSFVYHIYRQNIRSLRSEFIKTHIPGIVQESKKGSTPYDPQEFYKQVQEYFIQGMKDFQEANVAGQQKLQSWTQKVVESHTNLVKQYVDATNSRVQAVAEELKNQYKVLKGISKDNLRVADILDRVVSKLDAFSDVISNYDKTYVELLGKIEEFSQNFADLFSGMSTIVQTVSKPSQLLTNLYNSIQEMVNSQGHIIASNREFLKDTGDMFDKLLTRNDESNQEQLKNLRASLEAFLNEMRTTFSPQAMNELVGPHVGAVTGRLSELKDVMGLIDGKTNLMNQNEERMLGLIDSLAISVNNLGAVVRAMDSVTERIDKINRNLGSVFTTLTEA